MDSREARWADFVDKAVRRVLSEVLAEIDSMPVEKLENYDRWKRAREGVVRAIKCASDLAHVGDEPMVPVRSHRLPVMPNGYNRKRCQRNT